MIRSVMASLFLGASAGCGVTDDDCAGDDSVIWQYQGRQETPVVLELRGTLTIAGESCGNLTGRLDVVQTDNLGQVRELSGPISGRPVDGTSIRFDAYVEATPRQHVAMIRGDSLVGTWVSAGTGSGGVASGTFKGWR